MILVVCGGGIKDCAAPIEDEVGNIGHSMVFTVCFSGFGPLGCSIGLFCLTEEHQ